MKVLFAVAYLCLSAAFAQTCTDFVAVNGALLAGQAACYFGTTRDLAHAYIRTDLLTAALGLESVYNPDTSTLHFRKGEREVEIDATGDVAAATETRAGALLVSGQARSSSSAVLAGSSYLPVVPLVAAFGGHTGWNAAARTVLIDFGAPPARSAVTEDPAAGTSSSATAVDAVPGGGPLLLGAPRYGLHETHTRVALDVPAGLDYRLAVEGNNLVVLFAGAHARPFELTPDEPHLTSLGYAKLGDTLALIVGTNHTLGDDGRGFRVGSVPAETGEVLYIDFGATVRGEPVAKLRDLPGARLASVRRPASVRKTVVLDFGHGGKDPGAVSDYVVEKELVMQVGFKLKARLEARGIRVVLTRPDDTFVELERRSRVAVPSAHNLFVSLHANSTETAGAEGIEAWVFGAPQDEAVIGLAVFENGGGALGRTRTRQARRTAASVDGDLLREENLRFSTVLAESIQHALIAETGGVDRGVKQNAFSVLRNARVPAVLVELGFINHPVEGPMLATDGYQTRLAEALARGIDGFLQQGRRAQRD